MKEQYDHTITNIFNVIHEIFWMPRTLQNNDWLSKLLSVGYWTQFVRVRLSNSDKLDFFSTNPDKFMAQIGLNWAHPYSWLHTPELLWHRGFVQEPALPSASPYRGIFIKEGNKTGRIVELFYDFVTWVSHQSGDLTSLSFALFFMISSPLSEQRPHIQCIVS